MNLSDERVVAIREVGFRPEVGNRQSAGVVGQVRHQLSPTFP